MLDCWHMDNTAAATDSTPVYVNVPRTRLRVRRVDENAAVSALREKPGWRVVVRNGGSVANAYGYAADTEAALAVRDPQGRVVVWMARLPANKVTDRGAAEHCLPGAGALFDRRVTVKDHRVAAWGVIKAAFLRAWVTAKGEPLHIDAELRLGGDAVELAERAGAQS
jgi:phosphotransferase system IIB component